MNSTEHKVGDIVDGFILGPDNQWHQLAPPAAPAPAAVEPRKNWVPIAIVGVVAALVIGGILAFAFTARGADSTNMSSGPAATSQSAEFESVFWIGWDAMPASIQSEACREWTWDNWYFNDGYRYGLEITDFPYVPSDAELNSLMTQACRTVR